MDAVLERPCDRVDRLRVFVDGVEGTVFAPAGDVWDRLAADVEPGAEGRARVAPAVYLTLTTSVFGGDRRTAGSAPQLGLNGCPSAMASTPTVPRRRNPTRNVTTRRLLAVTSEGRGKRTRSVTVPATAPASEVMYPREYVARREGGCAHRRGAGRAAAWRRFAATHNRRVPLQPGGGSQEKKTRPSERLRRSNASAVTARARRGTSARKRPNGLRTAIARNSSRPRTITVVGRARRMRLPISHRTTALRTRLETVPETMAGFGRSRAVLVEPIAPPLATRLLPQPQLTSLSRS
jgi:hypothetical protein